MHLKVADLRIRTKCCPLYAGCIGAAILTIRELQTEAKQQALKLFRQKFERSMQSSKYTTARLLTYYHNTYQRGKVRRMAKKAVHHRWGGRADLKLHLHDVCSLAHDVQQGIHL